MVGLLHNLVVCKCESGENKGKYELLSGERRYKALSYLVQEHSTDENAPDWNRPYCIKLEGLSEVEKSCLSGHRKPDGARRLRQRKNCEKGNRPFC